MLIVEHNSVWNGCTLGELGLIMASHMLLPFVLIPILNITFILIISLFLTVLGLFVTTKSLQKIKRNKPTNYYQKKIHKIFANSYQQYNTYIKT